MTVGISLTNGKEAIVITDRRSSAGNRESDSFYKIESVTSENYKGVVYAAGNGMDALAILKKAKEYAATSSSLESFADTVKSEYGELDEQGVKQYLARQRMLIEQKASLCIDEHHRSHVVQQEIEAAMKKYEEGKSSNLTYFRVVGYDIPAQKTRQFTIATNGFILEDSLDTHLIGSGSDAAHLYFSATLSGIDLRTLDVSDLLFFGLNAYSHSTLNQGVGGSPKIAIISKDREKILLDEDERVLALTNLSGAYLARVSESLTLTNTRNTIRALLQAPQPQYAIAAELVGVCPKTLTGIYIPYSSWQERANRQLFLAKKTAE